MALEIEVQKGVALARKRVMGRTPRYPFRTMEVGEFFFVPRLTNNLMTAASDYGRMLGRKFKTRMVWAVRADDAWKLCEADDVGAIRGIGVLARQLT